MFWEWKTITWVAGYCAAKQCEKIHPKFDSQIKIDILSYIWSTKMQTKISWGFAISPQIPLFSIIFDKNVDFVKKFV